MKKLWVIVAILVIGASPVFADEIDDYINLLREDVKTVKKAIVMEVMDLSDAEGERFWPVYDEYQREVDKINNERLKVIKKFGDSYWDMDDGTAKNLVNSASDLQIKRDYLRKTYYRKFSYAIGATKAAKFFQLDTAISLLIHLQISAELPLVEKWD